MRRLSSAASIGDSEIFKCRVRSKQGVPAIRHRCSPATSVQTTRLQLAVGFQGQILVPYIKYTGQLNSFIAYATAAPISGAKLSPL